MGDPMTDVARVSGLSEGRVLETRKCLLGDSREECGRLAHADDVPLLLHPEDTPCHRCERIPRNEPSAHARTDQDPLCIAHPRRLTTS